MKKKIIIVIIGFFFLNLLIFFLNCSTIKSGKTINSLYAQTPRYPYRKYEDRKEGIVPGRQPVAGEKLELISVAIENLELIENQDETDKFNLAFYLKDSAQVIVDVREFYNDYEMQPLKTDYPSGLNFFSWPSEIPFHYNIFIEDLLPLVKVVNSGKKMIIPVIPYYKNPKNSNVSYIFGLLPRRTISSLEYKIYNSDTNELIYTGSATNLLKENVSFIRWNGKDQNNKPVRDGIYILKLTAIFTAKPGSTAKKVHLNFNFYHNADFFERYLLQ